MIQSIPVRFHRPVQSSEVVCLRFSLFGRVKQGSSPDPQLKQAAVWHQNRRAEKRTYELDIIPWLPGSPVCREHRSL